MSTTLRTSPPRRTRAKPNISYAEYSSSSDFEDYTNNSSPQAETITHRRTGSSKHKVPKTRQRLNSEVSESRRISKKRRQTTSKTLKTLDNESKSLSESGCIPPWQTLPYHIFVQIFKFASLPLYDENTFQPFSSVRWLLRLARLCRAFAEPALTVLYSSPPLVPMIQAHMLVDLLKADPIPLAFKYRQKVVSLQIEVNQVAAHSLRGSGYLDLNFLLRDLPRLRDLEFYHQKDLTPYRDLDVPIKWNYPDSIFEALEYIDPMADGQRGDKTSICKLRSWRWSSRLAGKKWPVERIINVHMKSSFRSIRKIAFVNYQATTLRDGEDPNHESVLSDALKVLSNLEHLIFESSTLLNSRLLPLLPQNLRNFELINCWEVTSEDLGQFLITHGQKLCSLTLNHNKSLNLTFLTVLGTACPKLQTLKMNMTYFNIHTSYRDSEPAYDHLLLPHQIPVWPNKLQTIELSQLRKWERGAAETFFTSLVESASDLPDLRRLSIQAILNVSWRNRASFRDKWVALLNKVFKRSPQQPTAVHLFNASIVKIDQLTPTSLYALSVETNHLSPCVNTELLQSGPGKNIEHQTETRVSPPRRSRRTTVRAIPRGRYVESSSSSSSEASEPEEYQSSLKNTPVAPTKIRGRLARELDILKATGGIDLPALLSSPPSTPIRTTDPQFIDKQRLFIQGMCEIVEVRIDNLRPAETQVTEADFLDEEISGDEDWNSEADEGLWTFESSDPAW